MLVIHLVKSQYDFDIIPANLNNDFDFSEIFINV